MLPIEKKLKLKTKEGINAKAHLKIVESSVKPRTSWLSSITTLVAIFPSYFTNQSAKIAAECIHDEIEIKIAEFHLFLKALQTY